MPIDRTLNEQLNSLFISLNGHYHSGKPSVVFHVFRPTLQQLADRYFNQGQTIGEQDAFFGYFTIVWQDMLLRSHFQEAEELWKLALDIVNDWETRNIPRVIHKGTPYYWLGVTQILADKIDDGFLSMHKALKEDERSHSNSSPSAPAYFFVTLDFQQTNQAFGPKVNEIAVFLYNKIGVYRSSRNGSLTIEQFKTRFLECSNLREVVFAFVYLLFKMQKISRTDKRLLENEFVSFLNLGLLFNLCMIIEKTIDNKKNCPEELRLYSNKIKHLINRTSLTLTISGRNEPGITRNEVNFISDEFDASFQNTITSILNNSHIILNMKAPIESDLMVSLGLRNQSAHELQNQPVVYQRWEDLSQRVLNVLFYTVEKLY